MRFGLSAFTRVHFTRQWPEQISPNLSPTIFDNEQLTGELIHSSLASESTTLENVTLWLQRYPDIVISSDSYGRLPLHYAVASSSAEAFEIVEFLVEFADASFRIQQLKHADQDGLLPLHVAAASCLCSSDIQ